MAFANIGSAELNVSGPSWAGSGSGPYTLTTAVAVPNLGANRVGVVLVSFQPMITDFDTFNGITWDGAAMTVGTAAGPASSGYSIAGYLVGATDNATVDVVISVNTNDGNAPSTSILFITFAWADADDPILFDAFATPVTGTSQNPVVATGISAAGLVMSQVSSAANALAATPFPDGTPLQTWDAGGNCFISGYTTPAGAGTINHTHAFSQSEAYTGVGISFIEDSGGGGTILPFMLQMH